jgi:hypothetical protein
MSAAWAARNTAIDLFLALVLAIVVAVSIWYFVGDGDKRRPGPWGSNPSNLRGEYAVLLGAESVGIPLLGDGENVWYFGELRMFVAAENPATDDRLKSWLAEQPGVHNVRVNRTLIPVEAGPARPDTRLTILYDRPEHLGPVPIDWPALGYAALENNERTPTTWLAGGPKAAPGHSRGVLWLIAVACANGALIVVGGLRCAGRLFRRRSPAESPPCEFDTESDEDGADTPPCPAVEALSAAQVIIVIVIAGAVLLGLVALHERLVGEVIPHATARGWVWFSSVDWTPKDLSRKIVYRAFLITPLGIQLVLRYLVVGRWRAAGRPLTGVLITAITFAVLWLDVSLVPLGLAVGWILGWLAVRGLPVIGLFALHALVNGALFGFVLTGSPPPGGHDQRLEGSWVPVDGGPKARFGRVEFTANSQFLISRRLNDGPIESSQEMYYLILPRDRLLVGAGRRSGTFQIAFEGNELVFTPAHRPPNEPLDRVFIPPDRPPTEPDRYRRK